MFATATRSCSRCIPAGARASTACSSRLFGTRRDTPGNPPGEISIYNEQTALNGIDVDRIEATMAEIRNIIKYPTYDISLLLVDDEEMRKTNLDTRGIDGPTDILSFPFQDVAVGGKPGELAEPEFDIEDYFSLGDMMLDVAYVMRRCEEDRRAAAAAGAGDDDKTNEPMIVEGAENDAESDNATTGVFRAPCQQYLTPKSGSTCFWCMGCCIWSGTTTLKTMITIKCGGRKKRYLTCFEGKDC